MEMFTKPIQQLHRLINVPLQMREFYFTTSLLAHITDITNSMFYSNVTDSQTKWKTNLPTNRETNSRTIKLTDRRTNAKMPIEYAFENCMKNPRIA